jgi:hypothetical protein
MVLCAKNEDATEFELLRPPAGAKIGERLTLEGNPIQNFSQEL